MVQADDFDEGPRAPAAVEAAAYFVVAEALTNAARHSGFGQAEVSLIRAGTGVRVVVRDDGKGGAVLSGDGTGGTGLSACGAGLPRSTGLSR